MPSQYRAQKAQPRGVRVQDARRLLLRLPNVAEGRSYGMPSFLLNGRFLARFRDDDTVLVLQLGTIAERDVLMQFDPNAFFFTELATAALGRKGYNDLAAGRMKFTSPAMVDTMEFILKLVPYYQPGFLATKSRIGLKAA